MPMGEPGPSNLLATSGFHQNLDASLHCGETATSGPTVHELLGELGGKRCALIVCRRVVASKDQ